MALNLGWLVKVKKKHKVSLYIYIYILYKLMIRSTTVKEFIVLRLYHDRHVEEI